MYLQCHVFLHLQNINVCWIGELFERSHMLWLHKGQIVIQFWVAATVFLLCYWNLVISSSGQIYYVQIFYINENQIIHWQRNIWIWMNGTECVYLMGEILSIMSLCTKSYACKSAGQRIVVNKRQTDGWSRHIQRYEKSVYVLTWWIIVNAFAWHIFISRICIAYILLTKMICTVLKWIPF